MTKYVRDTKAGKAISAYVVLRPDGTEVATINSHYSDGGVCLVNVFNYGKDNKTADANPFQCGRAGGGGYDKYAAALAGMEIDGHKMCNHCGDYKTPPKGGVWNRTTKAPKGWHFANFDAERNGYTDCYRMTGTKYLEAIGYRVIQAI